MKPFFGPFFGPFEAFFESIEGDSFWSFFGLFCGLILFGPLLGLLKFWQMISPTGGSAMAPEINDAGQEFNFYFLFTFFFFDARQEN